MPGPERPGPERAGPERAGPAAAGPAAAGPAAAGPAAAGPAGGGRPSPRQLLSGTLPAVLRRPHLWPVAVVTARRMVPRGWWRRRPWLPLPDPDYLAFRMETAYGDPAHPVEPGDLVDYLEWCRRHPLRHGYRW